MTARKLKVFRTSTGFHDIYVAVTSKKAALQAWGSDKDLFSMKAAELVTGPKLTKVPLEHPGEIIRVAKGSTAEHMKAAGRTLSKRNAGANVTAAAPPSKVRPKPSRRALDNAEAALAKFEEGTKRQLGDLRIREEQIREQRRKLESQSEKQRSTLTAKVSEARREYHQKLSQWD